LKKEFGLTYFWKRLKRNRLAAIGGYAIGFLILITIFAPALAPFDYATQNLEKTKLFPNRENLLGTDEFGRDILSMILLLCD
jgi:ABC-type antimicrobial peptide transport system permease subunit